MKLLSSLWGNLKRYSIYRKLLVSYLILVLLSITLISAVLYQRYAYQVESQGKQASLAQLEQFRNAVNDIHAQVIAVGNELLHDPDIITAMLSNKYDPLLENEVVLKFRSIQGVYPFIEYLSIYNGTNGRYLNYKGIKKEVDQEVIDLIRHPKDDQAIDFMPRVLDTHQFSATPSGESYRLLTFVLYSNFSNLIPKNGALIININEQVLLGRIFSKLSEQSDHKWMITDREGVILSHSDPAMFLQSYADTPSFRHIGKSAAAQGYFTEKSHGSKELNVYGRSKLCDWIIIGTRPYEVSMYGIDEPQTFLWVIGVGMAVIGIMLAALMAGRMYKPYSTFQRQQLYMESSLKSALPIVQETYYRRLLTGTLESAPKHNAPYWDISLIQGSFCVIVLEIDEYKKFIARPLKEQELVRFAIRNVTEELMASYGYQAIGLESNHLVVLAQLSQSGLPEGFLLTLHELQQTIRQYFHLTLSVGIGDTASKEDEIKSSYASAKEYLNYRLFLGRGSIIGRSDIAQQLHASGEYPAKTETALLEAINLGRRKEAEAEIARFIGAIGSLSYKHAFVYSNRLVISIQKKYDGALSLEDNDYEQHSLLLYSFSDLETLDEVAAALRLFCSTIMERLEEKRGRQNGALIESVRQLVRAKYADSSLSLESVAEQVHYSSGYLSKMFKQAEGVSFNDYLIAVRLEESIRLLLTTSESAAVISKQVGLGSSTYFFTLFKKTYGMTPAQFRTQHSLADLGDTDPAG